MKMITRCLLSIVLALTLSAPVHAAVSVGQVAPDFTLESRVDGSDVPRSDLYGSIVVIMFFSHWCQSCSEQMPELRDMVINPIKANGGVNSNGVPVKFYAISIDENDTQATNEKLQGMNFDRDLRDPNLSAFISLYYQGGIPPRPLYVVLNGVGGNNDYDLWEVAYSFISFKDTSSFPGGNDGILNAINRISPPNNALWDAVTFEGTTWKWHPVLDFVWTEAYPWVFSTSTNDWIWLASNYDTNFWFWSLADGGWFWSGRSFFPYAYSASQGEFVEF